MNKQTQGLPKSSCLCSGFSSSVTGLSPYTLASYTAWLEIFQSHLWLERPLHSPRYHPPNLA